jgi:hypothetical protein
MAQSVSRRFLTAKARFRNQVSPYGICGGQGGTLTGFLRVLRVSRASIISTSVSMMIIIIIIIIIMSMGVRLRL